MPRPGFEPGTPCCKRGMIVRFNTRACHRSVAIHSPVPQPGFEPGTPRSKRGMMAVSPPGHVRVDPPGIEPGLPACHTGVIPLDHRPVISGIAGSCTPISRLRRGRLPVGRRPHSRSQKSEVRSQESGVRSQESGSPVSCLLLSPVSCLLSPDSDLGGNRTHTPDGSRLSTGSGYQSYSTRSFPVAATELQTWELNPASRLMRPSRAPARLQGSGDGGIRTHTVHVLSVATPSRWSTSPVE